MPMEPVPADRAEDDPAWSGEVKWDGVRCIALVQGGRVRLWSRRLRERTPRFPEIQALAGQLPPGRYVLDGELVVLRDGRPSFPGILERDLAQGAAAARAAARDPAVYMVFDLLEAAGREVAGWPLERRQALLRESLRPGGPAVAVEGFPGAGARLLAAVMEQQLEGVVLKRLDSPYRPGDRSELWRKVKRRLRLLCAVGGYTVTGGRAGALLLGAYDRDGRLRYLGRAGSGLSERDLEAARELEPGPCPFDPVPDLRGERFSRPPDRVVWVRPRVTVWVEFAEWTEGLRLRSPVVKGLSPEPPEAARLP
ncbi:ATP-dependent DNA ligase [Caldinitratiruptor microaerophilus]|uniref:DNA ligase (ATP) n=2 Tax=Caldinitratiruptor microaerophilus TaxID=671077 RepID=A0AA35G5R6_9FIRM|nr:ATP-dependent DNA ligase [Caldinitratiruptor microaerophilus]